MARHPIALEAYDDRLAIVGTTGAGKTYAARGMVELLIRAGHRVCVVDPLGVWWGLRAGRDGKAEGGLPVLILGGAHADVPITDEGGAAVGRLAGSAHVQWVLDLSELASGAARRRFMRGFLDALFAANTEPLHLILDEADLWAPQRPMPEQTALQGLVSEIVRRGRVRGFIPWLITQRPAVLAKDVLSQADGLIALKLTSSQDRAAIGGWIEGQADKAEERRILADLPTLPRGTGWLWVPGRGVLERVEFPTITTFDSSRTPKRGEKRAGAALATVDAAAILAALRDQASPPAQGHAPASDADAVAAAYARGRAEGVAEQRQLLVRLEKLSAAAGEAAELLRHALALGSELGALPATSSRSLPSAQSAVAPPPPQRAQDAGEKLHSAARAILLALADRPGVALSWRQIATLAGLAPRGGHWETGRRMLRAQSLVLERGDGLVRLTDAGRARVPAPDSQRPATSTDLLQLWCGKLRSPAPEMLRAIAASRKPIAWDELARILGKQSRGGHWETGAARCVTTR